MRTILQTASRRFVPALASLFRRRPAADRVSARPRTGFSLAQIEEQLDWLEANGYQHALAFDDQGGFTVWYRNASTPLPVKE